MALNSALGWYLMRGALRPNQRQSEAIRELGWYLMREALKR
jgi:hypothetical protein